MRLIVARCEVSYSGRLTARLPEALRLLMVKADGSVLVHADCGGYKPLNWMTPPTVIEEEPGLMVVRKLKGDDRLEIRIAEVISDSEAAWSRLAHALARTDRTSECLAACDRALALVDDPEVRDLRERVVAAAPRAIEAAA